MNKILKLSAIALAAMVTCSTFAKSSNNDDAYDEFEGSMTFSLDTSEFPDTIGGNEVLTEFLPVGVLVTVSGSKLKTPKASSPKVKKVEGDYEVVVKEKGEDNPSGLKLKYKKKTGKVTGSFKIYTLNENTTGKPKLKKYSAKVSGTLGSEGGLTVTVSKAGRFSATLE